MANQTQNLDRKPEILTSGFICLESRSGKQLREVDQFLTIGRDPSNGLALSDAFVSARHARVERRDQGFVVRDLRSRNGTSLNGLPVLEARLSDGDRLKVGETELLFTSTRELKCHALTSQNAR